MSVNVLNADVLVSISLWPKWSARREFFFGFLGSSSHILFDSLLLQAALRTRRNNQSNGGFPEPKKENAEQIFMPIKSSSKMCGVVVIMLSLCQVKQLARCDPSCDETWFCGVRMTLVFLRSNRANSQTIEAEKWSSCVQTRNNFSSLKRRKRLPKNAVRVSFGDFHLHFYLTVNSDIHQKFFEQDTRLTTR